MTNCIIWGGRVSYSASTAHHQGEPYGRIGSAYVHRGAYESKHGKIPKGYQIDHLCRNTLCINVAHLEAVPPAENVRRGKNGVLIALRWHAICCKWGHERDPRRASRLGCLMCRNAACRRYYARHLRRVPA